MDPNLDAERQHSPPANDLKRRQSEVSEQESKRLRTSPGKISSLPEPSPARDSPRDEASRRDSSDLTVEKQATRPGDAPRKSSKINEKDRSRRLFGGLLGSLSQRDDSRTTKRRQEIESRRKAELQRQDDEHVEDKQRRLELLAEKRRRVKKEIEDETVCTYARRTTEESLPADHATRCATATAICCTEPTSYTLRHSQDL
jgi:hypothetical protein